MNKTRMSDEQFRIFKSKLPKKIVRKFVKNIVTNQAINHAGTPRTLIYALIDHSLVWSKTFEGKSYWNKLHNKWCIKEGHSAARIN